MKKVMKKLNRTLSIMLVAAMVLTMAPQTAMPVLAASGDPTVETPDVPENTETVVGETETDPADEQTEGSGDEIITPVPDDNTDPADGSGTEEPSDTEEPSETEDPVETEEPAETEEPTEVVDPTTNVNVAGDVRAGTVAAPVITVKKGAEELASGTKAPNRAEDVTFEIAAAEGADTTGVKFYYTMDGADPTAESTEYASAVTISAPDKNEEDTVTVKAIAIKTTPATEEGGEETTTKSTVATRNVVFAAKAPVATLASDSSTDAVVTIGETVLAADDEHQMDQTKDLVFSVTLAEAVQDTKEITAVEYKKAGDANYAKLNPIANGADKGKYKILKANMKKAIEIKVTVQALRQLTFAKAENTEWNMFTVTVTAKNNAKKDVTVCKDKTFTDDDATLAISNALKNVNVVISPATACTLTEAKVGEADPVKPAANKKITINNITLSAEAATTVTVTATEAYNSAKLAPATEGTGTVTPVTNNKNKFNVTPRAAYTLTATQGAGDTAYEIPYAEIENKAAITDAMATLAGGPSEEESADAAPWTLTVKKEAGDKTIKIAIYDKKETDGRKKLQTLEVAVAPVLKNITIGNGAVNNKNGKFTITQPIDSEKIYTITKNPAASKDTLAVKELSEEIQKKLTAEITEEGKLKITTKAAAVDADGVVIEIVNDSDEGEKATVATVTVKTKVPAWAAQAPKAKLTGSTDNRLNLSMSLPGTLKNTPGEGSKYYYVVTPKTTNKKPGEKINQDGKPRYYEVTGDKDQAASLLVIDDIFGKGFKENFNVDVQLAQYQLPDAVGAAEGEDPDPTTEPEGTQLAISKKATIKNAATKEPFYAVKLTLKKTAAANDFYTGQTAEVATVDFGKEATYVDDTAVKAELSGPSVTSDNVEGLDGTTEDNFKIGIKDGKVELAVPANAKTGKYTVMVTQALAAESPTEADKYLLPDGTQAAVATMQVNVVQGITSFSATTSMPKIYAPEKKASAAAKITTILNGGTSEKKPKTAKLTYTLGAINSSNAFEKAEKDSPIAKWINLKNGAVSIKKGYREAAETDQITDGKFAVEVTATDTGGNSKTAIVKFEITTDTTELGNIVLVIKVSGDEGDSYVPVGESAKKNGVYQIPANVAGDTLIRVLQKDAENKESYADADFVEAAKYSITLNNNAVRVNSTTGALSADKIVNNVTVKAATVDGSGKKAVNDGKVKFAITYEAVEGAQLKVTTPAEQDNDVTFTQDAANSKKYTGTVTTETTDVLTVKAVDGEGNELAEKLVDYKIGVQDGAAIVKNTKNLDLQIVMTAKTATLKLTNLKGQNAIIYTITNDKFTLKNAPAVSMVKGQKLYAGYREQLSQKVDFTIAKLPKQNAPEGIAKVRITARDDASKALLAKINGITDDNGILAVTAAPTKDAAGSFSLTFNGGLDVIKKATLYFEFLNSEGAAVTKSTAVTIKTELLKKAYKLQGKYNMSAKDASRVALTHTGKVEGVHMEDGQYAVEFTGLLNANIKGKINKFKDAFELVANSDEQGKFTNVLRIKNIDCAKKDYQAAEGAPKLNNLIGFVKYTVSYEDGSKQNFVSQITIDMKGSIKPAKNYKEINVTVLAEAGASVTTDVMVGKAKETLAVAEFVPDANAAGSDAFKSSYTEGGSSVIFTSESEPTINPAKKKGTLFIVPSDSYYAAAAKTAYEAAQNASDDDAEGVAETGEKTWAQYKADANIVIPIKVTITVKAADTTDAKIAIANKVDFSKVSGSSQDDEGNYGYKNEVPYTWKIAAKLAETDPIELVSKTTDDKDTEAVKAGISVAKAESEDNVVIFINKKTLTDYVLASYNKNTKKFPKNGAEVKADVKFNFAAEGSKSQIVKLTIKLPKLAGDELKGVTGVTITKPTANATINQAEGAYKCEATVNAIGLTEEEKGSVTWSIEGTVVTGTQFGGDNGDELSISENETAESITIKATSTKDPSKSATVTITPGMG